MATAITAAEQAITEQKAKTRFVSSYLTFTTDDVAGAIVVVAAG